MNVEELIKYDRKFFGQTLHRLRTGRGLTRLELGFKVGVSDTTIGCYENGISLPGIEIFYSLCAIFEVAPKEFLKREVE